MKKIIFSAVIESVTDSVGEHAIHALLERLGSPRIQYLAGIDVAELATTELRGAVTWLYLSGDDDEPAFIVSRSGQRIRDNPISGEAYITLRESGVCTEFYAQYPNADKYGIPEYAANDLFAEGEVSKYGFRVPKNGMSIISTIDRGDDGSAELWLKIVNVA